MSACLQTNSSSIKAKEAEGKAQINIINLSDFIEHLHKLRGARKEGKELSDIEKKVVIPLVCQYVHASDKGPDICLGVLTKLKNLLKEIPDRIFVTVFCCLLGAKALACKVGKQTYLVICRSPLLHLKHIEDACAICKIEKSIFKKWLMELPEFDAAFCEQVKHKFREIALDITNEDREELERRIDKVVSSYGMFEFDTVIYDILQEIAKQNGTHRGLAKVEFVSKIKDKNEPVVRIVVDKIRPEEERIDGHMLIVGLVVQPPKSRQLIGYLDEPLVAQISELLSKADLEKENYQWNNEPWWVFGQDTNNWRARVKLYLKEEPNSFWLDNVHGLISSAIEAGAGTVLDQIIRHLVEKNWNVFRKKICKHSNRMLHQTTSGEFNTLYSLVFNDLATVLEQYINLETLPSQSTFILKIEQLFSLIRHYPRRRIVFDPPLEMRRLNCLKRDLLGGGSEYQEMLKKEIIPAIELEKYKWRKETVSKNLMINPDLTVESMLWATKNRIDDEEFGLDLGKEENREKWKTVLDFYRKHGLVDKMETIQKRLYEITAHKSKQQRGTLWREFMSEFLRAVTLGLLSPSSTIRYAEQKAHAKHMTELGIS